MDCVAKALSDDDLLVLVIKGDSFRPIGRAWELKFGRELKVQFASTMAVWMVMVVVIMLVHRDNLQSEAMPSVRCMV